MEHPHITSNLGQIFVIGSSLINSAMNPSAKMNVASRHTCDAWENKVCSSFINLYCANRCIHLATYGGHLELSAFAHLTQRNVKVVQPGLVYVIEWAAGGDAPISAHSRTSTEHDSSLDEREQRRLRRDSKRADRRQVDDIDGDDNEKYADPSAGAVYVA